MIARPLSGPARTVRTIPNERGKYRKPRHTRPALTPEQIAEAVEQARNGRIQADLLDYARSHPMNENYDDVHSIARAYAVMSA